MGEVDRERRLQRIKSVFPRAAGKAKARIAPRFKLEVSGGADGAVIIISSADPDERLRITFVVGARGAVYAGIGEHQTVGIGRLGDDGIEENIANTITDAVAKEFG